MPETPNTPAPTAGPDDKPPAETGTPAPETPTPDTKPGKGDPGDELTAERTARETAEKEAARLRRSNAAQTPADLEALRAEVRAEFTTQLVRAEVRAAATGRLRDPADALALVDLDALAGKGGEIDQAAITAALDKLVADKPYLAAEASSAGPWGDVGAGQRTAPEPEPDTPFDRLRQAYGTTS